MEKRRKKGGCLKNGGFRYSKCKIDFSYLIKVDFLYPRIPDIAQIKVRLRFALRNRKYPQVL